MTWISLDATLRQDAPGSRWPYRNVHAVRASVAADRQIRVRALPYFAWGNRAGLGMRIWLPTETRRRDD
jgi:DUF1680 family protein